MAALPISKQHLTLDEVQSMVEAGVFAEDDRLELIRGFAESALRWQRSGIVMLFASCWPATSSQSL